MSLIEVQKKGGLAPALNQLFNILVVECVHSPEDFLRCT
jgi:hypothetical protein